MLEKYTLPNGIPVFIVENHASPVVSIQAWVRQGSAHEPERLAGISHFLEHALFKGTKKRKVGEIALEIEARGGEVNAYTSFEETVYYTTLASRYFKEGLDVISDAIKNPVFDKQEMAREKEVILEEIKRAQDSPSRILFYNLWKSAFKDTPYGRPVLGFVDTVKKIQSQSLKNYFEKHYHTGTMAMIVVGDINSKKALPEIKKQLSRVRKGKPLKKLAPIRIEPKPNRSVKVMAVKKDVNQCSIQIAFPSFPIDSPMIPALDLACNVIGSGESSRLYQETVKKKHFALNASMGLIATNGCGLATLSIVAAPEKLVEAIDSAWSVLQETLENGIDPREIDRVKSGMESESVYSKETVEGYAKRIGYYFTHFGDPDYEADYLDSVLNTELVDIHAALKVLLKSKPLASMIHPLDYKVPSDQIKKILSTPLKPPAKTPSKDLGLQRIEKGSSVFISKKLDHLPTVASRIIFKGGSKEENELNQGVGNLYDAVWASGTADYTSLEIASLLESLGASVSPFMGKNTFGLGFECLTKHWPRIKPIVQGILCAPTFPEEELANEKRITLRQIAAEKDTPSQLCFQNFLKTIYGDHPYGRSPLGTEETVSKLAVSDLKQYHSEYAYKKNCVVSSVGSFDSDFWLKEMEDLISPLPDSGTEPRKPTGVAKNASLQLITAQKQPLFQSQIALGFLGSTFKDQDRYALKVLSSCLSGQGGRLFLELRDKQSLAYTVMPINSDGPEPGNFAFYIACSPEKLQPALSGIRKEVNKLVEKPITKAELSRAKRYWLGRFELEMQRYSAQAMLFGLDEIYGHGYEHSKIIPEIINSISAQDCLDAAQKYFTLDKPVISVVHPEELDEEMLIKSWQG